MRKLFSRLGVTVAVALVGVLTVAGAAFAAPGDPPSLDVSTMAAPLNDFGSLVLAGVITLIGIVLVIKGPFVLVRLVLNSINKLFGRAKPSTS
jgi:hypothetical protein